MPALIVTLAVGILCIVLGVSNMMGNISSLHSYHRHRVRPEDVKPLGRLVGIGTITVGGALIIFGALMFAFEQTGYSWLTILGTALLIAGIALGTGVSFYAMIKYNKGIF